MNSKNAGRKNKYDTHIKPQLKNIPMWAREMTEKDIAKRLGVTEQAFIKYKRDHIELVNALKEGQQDLVSDLRSALIRKALGYEYTEKTIVSLGIDKNTGEEKNQITIHHRVAHPDVNAINLLLNNYDKDNWSDNWHERYRKDKELELRIKELDNKLSGWN